MLFIYLAEKPNQDLARIMRCLLYSSGLGSEFWSYALRHAVYLKNRLPHSANQWKTPYTIMNNKKPDLSRLRIFGSRVQIKTPGRRKMNLDRISNEGLFMTYTGSDKIVYVVNKRGRREQAVTHVSFDEAHMSSSIQSTPPMGIALQQAGYRKTPFTEGRPVQLTSEKLKVKLLSNKGTLPIRSTEHAAGLDICSAENAIIQPGDNRKIHTDIAMEIPPGHYGQLKSRSGLALKDRITVEAGVIDSDYRAEIGIILDNKSDKAFTIEKGDRIAQLIIMELPMIEVQSTDKLNETSRGEGGFGSTGIKTKPNASTNIQHHSATVTSKDKDINAHTNKQSNLPRRSARLAIHPTTAQAATLHTLEHCLDDHPVPTCNVELSQDPFLDTERIQFMPRKNDVMQGLVLEDSKVWDNRVTIRSCRLGTATRRIHKWKQRLKNATLLQINGETITSASVARSILKKHLHKQPDKEISLLVSNDERQSIHHEEGVPLMYFDQLATINQHLNDIKYDTSSNTSSIIQKIESNTESTNTYLHKILQTYAKYGTLRSIKGILPKNKRRSTKLTRRKLQQQPDWNDWRKSEWKQLDQYEDQLTFSEPCELPPGANVLDLLWTYHIKDPVNSTDIPTKKARCVCNGKPTNKNTVIFGHTFAKMLDHVGSRIFWASVAAKNFIVRGADASNAFAEAPPPKIPLYVRIDKPYREWYKHKYGKTLADNMVLRVKKALQGHPESPRAWAQLIDKILQTKLGLKPTTHEPCLYYGTFKGEEVLFLRQVDDFAVSSSNDKINKQIIEAINNELSIEIKDLGRLTRYNGVDVTQTKHYVKLSNETYFKKVLEGHDWMLQDQHIATEPIPMKSEKDYLHLLETSTGPNTDKEQKQLQQEMGFNYRQAIGELIYMMVTCRPDISFPLIKLSQYNNNPSQLHYEAVKHLFKYLKSTISDGLYYWRGSPREDLPIGMLPTVRSSNYVNDNITEDDNISTIHGAVDSDWGGDTKHRKSVTGLVIRMSGGTIVYKTKYQDTIALSSTEAEFTAACDVGRAILYVRSILDQINLPQDNATPIFIDNNGAMLMANAQQPTRRTRHMDMRKFILQEWVQRDLLIFKRIKTIDNYADSLTKALPKDLHYRHNDYILGKKVPKYYTKHLQNNPHSYKTTTR